MKVVICHDTECPLSEEGLHRRDAAACNLYLTKLEQMPTAAHIWALAVSWNNLVVAQVCTCGASEEIYRRQVEESRAESSAAS